MTLTIGREGKNNPTFLIRRFYIVLLRHSIIIEKSVVLRHFVLLASMFYSLVLYVIGIIVIYYKYTIRA